MYSEKRDEKKRTVNRTTLSPISPFLEMEKKKKKKKFYILFGLIGLLLKTRVGLGFQTKDKVNSLFARILLLFFPLLKKRGCYRKSAPERKWNQSTMAKSILFLLLCTLLPLFYGK
jgi:hypothetical protein